MDKNESWIARNWRPLAAITYIFINIFDFVIAPVYWPLILNHLGQTVTAWVPLTLQGGGLMHVSFGAILGVAAWTRGQEKLATIQTEVK